MNHRVNLGIFHTAFKFKLSFMQSNFEFSKKVEKLIAETGEQERSCHSEG